jgi:hypothetical protein
VIYSNDFSTINVTSASRYTNSDVGDWVSRYSNWTTAGTDAARALNCDLSAAYNETPVELLYAVSESDTSLTKITISFKYSVPADATLYFYAAGYEGPLTTGLNGRLTDTNGEYYLGGGDDFDGHLGTGYNLLNGATPTGAAATALTTLSNASGTFTQTYDISAFGVGFNITDFDYMTLVFGVDTTATSGSITVDNFTVTAIPEPAAIGLLGLGALITLLISRHTRRS